LAEKGSQSAIARALDVSQQAVNKWVHGIAKPSSAGALLAIERLYGIPVSDWDRPAREGSERRQT
jgi:transcriptional regulator with XRE-family HTH domain